MDEMPKRSVSVADLATHVRFEIDHACLDCGAVLERAASLGSPVEVSAARADLVRVVTLARRLGLAVSVAVEPALPVETAYRVVADIEAIILVSPPRPRGALAHGTLDKLLAARRFLDGWNAAVCDTRPVALGVRGVTVASAPLVVGAGADLVITSSDGIDAVTHAVVDELTEERLLRPALAR
jgi:pentose-5-phosphate-3-epimerase